MLAFYQKLCYNTLKKVEKYYEKTKAHKPHYVDNKKFLEAMIEYRARSTNAEEQERK